MLEQISRNKFSITLSKLHLPDHSGSFFVDVDRIHGVVSRANKKMRSIVPDCDCEAWLSMFFFNFKRRRCARDVSQVPRLSWNNICTFCRQGSLDCIHITLNRDIEAKLRSNQRPGCISFDHANAAVFQEGNKILLLNSIFAHYPVSNKLVVVCGCHDYVLILVDIKRNEKLS